MTRYRVTMIPDTSDWPEDSLRWVAGFDQGLHQVHDGLEAALECVETVTGIEGWAAEMEPLEDEVA